MSATIRIRLLFVSTMFLIAAPSIADGGDLDQHSSNDNVTLLSSQDVQSALTATEATSHVGTNIPRIQSIEANQDRKPLQNELPTVSIAASSADEGEDIEFTVTLSEAVTGDVSFKYATSIASSDTAEAADFTAVTTSTGTGTIAAGDTTVDITVSTNTDTIDEPNETFTVTLSDVTPTTLATLGDASSAQGTINDETEKPIVTVSNAADVTELDGRKTARMRFPISLTGTSEFPIVLRVNVIETEAAAEKKYWAEVGSDFGIASNPFIKTTEFTIPALATSANFDINIIGDDIFEADGPEVVTLTFAAKDRNRATVRPNTFVTGNIVENEDPPKVSIDSTNTTFKEGSKVPVKLNLEHQVDDEYSVTLTVTSDAKTADDYDQKKTTLTIPELTNRSITIDDVVVFEINNAYEGTEEIGFSLSGVTPTTHAAVDPTDVIDFQITDATPTPKVAIERVRATEGATLQFPVTLNYAASEDVEVAYSTEVGTASRSDYGYFSGRRTITLPARSKRVLIAIPTVQDDLYEAEEEFTIKLQKLNTVLSEITIRGNESVGTGGIKPDNDKSPRVTITNPSADTMEGDTMEFPLELTEVSGVAASIPYTITGTAAAADYKIDTPSPVSIAAGKTQGTIELSIVDDQDTESEESITITLGTPTHARLKAREEDSTATGNITDNDSTPNLSIADASVSEGESVNLTISTAPTSTSVINGTWSTKRETARGNRDYTAVGAGTFSIAANASSTMISVSTIEDNIHEGNETFTVTIVSSDESIARVHRGTATVTIQDDDAIPDLSLVGGASAAEGKPIDFGLKLSRPSASDITFTYNTTLHPRVVNQQIDRSAASANDFAHTAVATTYSTAILAGDTTGTLRIATTDDALHEFPERFLVTIQSATGAKLGSVRFANGTINDNDPAPQASISAPTTTRYTESDTATDTSTATFTISLDAVSGVPARLSVSQDSDSQADNGSDFKLPTNTTIVVPEGASSATFDVTLLGDDIYEGDETASVTIEPASKGNVRVGTGDTASIVIVENESIPILSASSPTVDEDDETASVTITSATKSAVGLDFKYVTLAGTAGTSDYTHVATKTAVSLAAEALTTSISIAIVDDEIDESSPESFSVQLSDLTPAGKAKWSSDTATLSTTVNITDDDPVPSLSIEDGTATEGDTIEFELSLTNPSAHAITYTWKTTDGTAIAANGDYVPQTTAKTETIPAGETTDKLVISTVEDNIDEPDSKFTVTISSSDSNVSIDDGTASATIEDDDGTPVISFTAVPSTVAEPSEDATTPTAVSLAITISPRSHRAITLPYEISADSTASLTSDYTTSTPSPLTIPAKGTGASLNLSFVGDGLYEGDETIEISLKSPSPAGAATLHASNAEAEILIDDKELLPHVTFKETAITVEEGEKVNLVLEMDPPADLKVPVRIDTVIGTGYTASANDFRAISNQSVTFGKSEVKKSLNLQTIDDESYEGNETLGVTITPRLVVPLRAVTTGRTTVVTITSDDDSPVLSINEGRTIVVEGHKAIVKPTLSNPSNTELTVKYGTRDSSDNDDYSAKAGEDFIAPPANSTLTIPAGSTTVPTIEIQTVDDASDEPHEEFGIYFYDAPTELEIPSKDKVIFIQDNDDESIEVSISSSVETVSENRGATNVDVSVSLSAQATGTIEVPFVLKGTATENADYSVVSPTGGSRTLTFSSTTPTVTSQNISIKILNDTTLEVDETIIVELGEVSGATGSGSHTITIEDDESDPTVEIANATSVTEGNDTTKTTKMSFDVSLSFASPKTVTVPYTVGGVAKSGDDYESHGENASITIDPTETSASIDFEIKADDLHEGNETLTVTLGTPTNATVAAGKGVGSGTITDDDRAPYVSVSDAAEVEENDDGDANKPMTFSVSLDKTAALEVSVPYTLGGTATVVDDYIGHGATPTVTVAVGDDSAEITVQVVGDDVKESDETITVTLGTPTNATVNPAAGSGVGSGTIKDNESLPVVSVADAAAQTEGDAATGPNLVFKVSLDAAGSLPVTVPYKLSGTATSGADYVAHESDASITIAAGETSADIEVVIIGDLDEEESETVIVTLSAPTNARLSSAEGADTGTGTINDDDPLPTVSVANATAVTEGDSASGPTLSFAVSLDREAKKEVTVPYSLGGSVTSGEDYVAHGDDPSITIAAESSSGTIEVVVIGDVLGEDNETVTVTLGTPTNGKLPADGSSATGTIQDDDDLPSVSVADATAVTEGDSSIGPTLSFAVSLSAPAKQIVTVPYSLSGSATSAVDYVAHTEGSSITISAGGSSATISVSVIGDLIDEDNETVTVTLASPTNAVLEPNATTASGTIQDDDTDPIASISDASDVTEGDDTSGGPTLIFPVSLNAPGKQNVVLPYTVSGDATSGEDYLAPADDANIIIVSGETTGAIEIQVLGDEESEGHESVIVSLGSPINADLSPGSTSATALILDDELPTLVISGSDAVLEGNVGSSVNEITLALELSHASTEEVSISYELGGTAQVDEDYSVAGANEPLTIASGETSGSIVLTILADSDFEEDETIEVTLTSVEGAQLAAAPSERAVSITIQNDDIPSISFSRLTLSVPEGQTASYSMSLSQQPSESFTVTPTLDSDEDITITESVNFSPEDWSEARVIEIGTNIDSDAVEERLLIRHIVTPSKFAGAVLDHVGLSIQELDVDGLMLSTEALSITETVSSSYSINLLAQPIGNVTVESRSVPANALQLSESLTFTPDNWTVPQTVSVSAIDNGADVNNEAQIVHEAIGSNYETLSHPTVFAEITNDEDLRVILDRTSIEIAESDSVTYGVSLGNEPGGDVTVTAEVDDADLVTVDSDPLTFTPQNWRIRQLVTLTSIDNDVPNDQSAIVRHVTNGSAAIEDSAVLNVTITDNDQPRLKIDRAFLVVEEGTRAAYQVSLTSPPNENVVVRIGPTDSESEDQFYVTQELTFTPDDWQISQTVDFVSHADNIAEETLLVHMEHVAMGAAYAEASVTLPISITDDDLKGLQLSSDELWVLEDGTTEYTVRLTSEPTDSVTVTPRLDNSISPAVEIALGSPLVFTPWNWDQAQSVTIRGLSVELESDTTIAVNHVAVGGGYDSFVEKSLQVRYFDKDATELVIHPESISLNQGAASTYQISLTSEPTSDIVIAVELDPMDAPIEVTDRISFTTANWQMQQTVSVALELDASSTRVDAATINHSVVEGTLTTQELPSVDLNIVYDEPAVMLSEQVISLAEGDSGTVSMWLSAAPSGELTIVPGLSLRSVPLLEFEPWTLTFGPEDWSTPKSIQIISKDNEASGIHNLNIDWMVENSTDGTVMKGGQTRLVIFDNDTPTLVTDTSSIQVEEGESINYQLRLGSQPSDSVVIDVSTLSADLLIEPASLSYDASNWMEYQPVTLQAIVDDDDSDSLTEINHDVASGSYQDANTLPIEVRIVDKDMPGVDLTDHIIVHEGSMSTYTIALTSQPHDVVSVSTLVSDDTVLTASPSVQFNSENWSEPQEITVSAIDNEETANAEVTIQHALRGSQYGDLRVPQLRVQVLDNDEPAVHVAPTSLSLDEGNRASYKVVLQTEPSGGVSLAVSSSAPSVVSVPEAIEFTSSNWNVAQVVDVETIANSIDENTTVTISHMPSGGGYDDVAVSDVVVNVNDVEPVSADPSNLTIANGASGTYSVTLNQAPEQDLVITPIASVPDALSVTPASVTVLATNWEQPIKFNVVADGGLAALPAQRAFVISHTVATADANVIDAASGRVIVTVKAMQSQAQVAASIALVSEEMAFVELRLSEPPLSPVRIKPPSARQSFSFAPNHLSFAPGRDSLAKSISIQGDGTLLNQDSVQQLVQDLSVISDDPKFHGTTVHVVEFKDTRRAHYVAQAILEPVSAAIARRNVDQVTDCIDAAKRQKASDLQSNSVELSAGMQDSRTQTLDGLERKSQFAYGQSRNRSVDSATSLSERLMLCSGFSESSISSNQNMSLQSRATSSHVGAGVWLNERYFAGVDLGFDRHQIEWQDELGSGSSDIRMQVANPFLAQFSEDSQNRRWIMASLGKGNMNVTKAIDEPVTYSVQYKGIGGGGSWQLPVASAIQIHGEGWMTQTDAIASERYLADVSLRNHALRLRGEGAWNLPVSSRFDVGTSFSSGLLKDSSLSSAGLENVVGLQFANKTSGFSAELQLKSLSTFDRTYNATGFAGQIEYRASDCCAYRGPWVNLSVGDKYRSIGTQSMYRDLSESFERRENEFGASDSWQLRTGWHSDWRWASMPMQPALYMNRRSRGSGYDLGFENTLEHASFLEIKSRLGSRIQDEGKVLPQLHIEMNLKW